MFEHECTISEAYISCDVSSDAVFTSSEHTQFSSAIFPALPKINPYASVFNHVHIVYFHNGTFKFIDSSGETSNYDIEDDLFALESDDPCNSCCVARYCQAHCLFAILLDGKLWCILRLAHFIQTTTKCYHHFIVAFDGGKKIFNMAVRDVFKSILAFREHFIDYRNHIFYIKHPIHSAFTEINMRTLKHKLGQFHNESPGRILSMSMDQHGQVWIMRVQNHGSMNASFTLHACDLNNTQLLKHRFYQHTIITGWHHPVRHQYYLTCTLANLNVFSTRVFNWNVELYKQSDDLNRRIILCFECINLLEIDTLLPTELRELIYYFLPIYLTNVQSPRITLQVCNESKTMLKSLNDLDS